MKINYDETADVVIICGVRYSGELFRRLGVADPGTWLRIEERKDQTLTVFTVSEEMARSFDAISGRGIASMPK